MRRPISSTPTAPSSTGPQSRSMSSAMRAKVSLLEAIFTVGAGSEPKAVPWPVVIATSVAPPAICPVTATGS